MPASKKPTAWRQEGLRIWERVAEFVRIRLGGATRPTLLAAQGVGQGRPRDAEDPGLEVAYVGERGPVTGDPEEDVLRDIVGIHPRRHAATQERTQRLDEREPTRVVVRTGGMQESGHSALPVRRRIR